LKDRCAKRPRFKTPGISDRSGHWCSAREKCESEAGKKFETAIEEVWGRFGPGGEKKEKSKRRLHGRRKKRLRLEGRTRLKLQAKGGAAVIVTRQ